MDKKKDKKTAMRNGHVEDFRKDKGGEDMDVNKPGSSFEDDCEAENGDESSGVKQEDSDGLMMDESGSMRLTFDFEAYPMNDNDKEGIADMLTQIFLRADVDVEGLAHAVIRQSPFGCVFRPTEECNDEDNEDVVYGMLSMIGLCGQEKFQRDIWSLLLTRAKKYAVDKKLILKLENLSKDQGANIGLLLNERMLHFPAAIAAPAFTSLKSDLLSGGAAYNFSTVIMIIKIRIADAPKTVEAEAPKDAIKKKLSKAAKKRAAAAAIADAGVIFDNLEEELLFQEEIDFSHFQYPVQSDVEKESKFSAVVLNGVTYRPYRRVCLLSRETFDRFVNTVSVAQGL